MNPEICLIVMATKDVFVMGNSMCVPIVLMDVLVEIVGFVLKGVLDVGGICCKSVLGMLGMI